MRKYLLIIFLGIASFLSAGEQTIKDSYGMVILGGGIGGLTSALYAGRAGMKPLVIEGFSPGGALTQSHGVQNWPGEIEIPGWELTDKIRKQAELSGAQVLKEEVVSVDFSTRPFTIVTRDLIDPEKTQRIKADACVIALGSSSKFLGIPGEQGDDGYWQRGVYNCAVCDGPLYKNKTVAVVGGGDGAIIEAHYLSQIAKKVYIILRKDAFRTVEEHRKREVLARPNVEVIYNTTVREIFGDGEAVTQLMIKNELQNKFDKLNVDALFLAIGSKPNTDLFRGQLQLDKLGYIVPNGDVLTSVPGVFAIGDIADRIYRQAISAASDGMKAAYQVEKYLASVSPPEHSHSVAEFTEITKTASSPCSQVIEIQSEEEFHAEIKKGTAPTLVDFYATWCGPCQVIAPYFSSLAKQLGCRVRFLKVNVDNFPLLSHQYRISAMPSMLIFDRQGNLLAKKVGSKDIVKYLRQLDKIEAGSPEQFEHIFSNKSSKI
jgi:thioredoxin reductase (NADPH)